MAAIGRGLMANPRLLLLDEPSLGLAPLMVREIFRTIKELHRRVALFSSWNKTLSARWQSQTGHTFWRPAG